MPIDSAKSAPTKAEKDRWWHAFRKYLDDNPQTGETVHRWQKLGCDLRGIAVAMHQFVIGEDAPIRERRSRGQLAKKVLPQAIHWMSELEGFYRMMLLHEDANRIASEVRLAKERLANASRAFDTKHLGTSRRWEFLAIVEGYVFEATKARPTAAEIVSLIQAARFALGSKSEPWDTRELVTKNLRKFKENNPDKSVLWTNPSSRLRATAVPLPQKRN